METVMSLMVGLGLSAACGFRIFVPLTIMSLLAQVGWFQLAPELAWAASPVALTGLLAATFLEIGAYYIPWLDNLLDSITTPVAVAAGTLLTFGFAPELHNPFAQWSLALIAGGGLAGTVQATTVATRATSSVTTGGLGNHLVATLEAILATAMAILALLMPVLALIAVAVLLILMLRLIRKWRARRKAQPVALQEPL